MEIVARRLDEALPGETIESALTPGINALKTFDPPFSALTGAEFTGARRRGSGSGRVEPESSKRPHERERIAHSTQSPWPPQVSVAHSSMFVQPVPVLRPSPVNPEGHVHE